MDDSAFNKLPDDLKEKVRQSRQAYHIATAISYNLADRFAICNLRVAATAEGAVVITGIVDSHANKQEAEVFLAQSGNGGVLTNNLAIAASHPPVTVTVNKVLHTVSSLKQLQALFGTRNEGDNLTYSLSGQGGSRLILLTNPTHALGIYLRFDGDAGYTTYNPDGNLVSKQDFILSNGQVDEYGEDMLTDIGTAFDIMRYYLLTERMHPGVLWREEGSD